MERKTSVQYLGVTFVPLTARPRKAIAVVHHNVAYVKCGDKKIATADDYLFTHSRPHQPAFAIQAMFQFGMLTQSEMDLGLARAKLDEEELYRRTHIRDLKYALDELGLVPSEAQQLLLSELEKHQ